MISSKNALDILFEQGEAINQERIHQIILKILLQESAFSKLLLNTKQPVKNVLSEPGKGIFDLSVLLEDSTEYLLELKMWSELKGDQVSRQKKVLGEKQQPVYILLGRSRFEWNEFQLRQESPNAIKLSYEELIAALEGFSPLAASPELSEFVRIYKTHLENHFSWLENAWDIIESPAEKNMAMPYYYSAYAAIQKELTANIPTKIFAAQNPHSADYILQATNQYRYYDGTEIAYPRLELHNGTICIRLSFTRDKPREVFETSVNYLKANIKEKLREEDFLLKEGKFSKQMKVLYMPLDFKITGIKKVAEVFMKWNQVLVDLSV